MPESSEEQQLRAELAVQDRARQAVKDRLDREQLRRVTNDMIQAITSPEFVERVRLARAASDRGEGMDAAVRLLSIEGLREAGVDIPEDFRMTSRVFEDREQGVRISMDEPRALESEGIEVLSWGSCAGAGGLTFCGCGGFSV
jgi:hypothetical protein